MLRYTVPFLAAALVSHAIARLIIRHTSALGLVDIPNARSSHTRPTPRGGGVGIVAGAGTAVALLSAAGKLVLSVAHLSLLAGFMLMALTGYLSDRFEITARVRLLLQAGIALGALLAAGGRLFPVTGAPLWLESAAAVVWLVGMTNFYNFMDGVDGMAGLQGLTACAAVVLFGACAGVPGIGVTATALAGAIAGFLVLNVTPARVFMGDAGSYALGFFFAAIPLLDTRLFVPVAMVMGVFLFDATVTLARRAARGERWYEAHRSHFYQRAAGLGLSHMRISGTAAGLSALCAAAAWGYLVFPSIRLPLVAGTVLLLCVPALWVAARERSVREDRKNDTTDGRAI